MNVPEPIVLYLLARDLPQQLSALGRTAGIYVFMSNDRITHLSSSVHLGRRLRRLFCLPEGGPTVLSQRLQDMQVTVKYWTTSSRLESSLLLYHLARTHFPEDYVARLRLRLPWFVALVDYHRFARLTVTNRLPKGAESVLGPFRNREQAQQYEESLLAAFTLRRCWEELRPALDHPGCIYGEIRLCSRPCQAAINDNEYRYEASLAKDLFLTNGVNAIHALCLARDKAAAETDFESAAHFHKQIEKLKAIAKNRDSVVADLENFHGVAVTEGPETNKWQLWPMLSGFWQEPVTIGRAENLSSLTLLERHLQELLGSLPTNSNRIGDQTEHLAIFIRWYYSSWRDGEWITWPDLTKIPYRKLARYIFKRTTNDTPREPILSC